MRASLGGAAGCWWAEHRGFDGHPTTIAAGESEWSEGSGFPPGAGYLMSKRLYFDSERVLRQLELHQDQAEVMRVLLLCRNTKSHQVF